MRRNNFRLCCSLHWPLLPGVTHLHKFLFPYSYFLAQVTFRARSFAGSRYFQVQVAMLVKPHQSYRWSPCLYKTLTFFIKFLLLLLFCGGSTLDQTQGLLHARQVLHYWPTPPVPAKNFLFLLRNLQSLLTTLFPSYSSILYICLSNWTLVRNTVQASAHLLPLEGPLVFP